MNYAFYGKIPYGFLFTGKLFYDLDDKEDDYACKDLNKMHENYSEKLGVFPIIMVDRGNCTFTTKTRNVQKLGGSLALIVNNEEHENLEDIIMIDDGTASDIFIPTVLISKQDGDRIKKYLGNKANGYSTQKEFNENVDIILNVEFDMTKTEVVDLKIFFTSSDLKIYKLISDLHKYSDFLMSNTTFSPHYVSFKSLEYSQGTSEIPNCLVKGLYCAIPRYDLGIFNGKTIIMEDIRQKCIFNIAKEKYKSEKFKLTENNKLYKNQIYFDYMINFKENCLNKTDSGNEFDSVCAKKVLNKIELDADFVEECIMSSYTSGDNSKKLNSILEEEISTKSLYQIKLLPSILVNKKPIVSTWNSVNVMEAICAGYNKRPVFCNKILEDFSNNKNSNEESGISASTYFVIICIAIMLNGLIYLFCKFYLNKKIETKLEEVDMNGTINSVLSNYLKLKNTG